MKLLKLILGSLLMVIGFLLLMAEEIPGEELNLGEFIGVKVISLLMMLLGYKLLVDLNILNEHTKQNGTD